MEESYNPSLEWDAETYSGLAESPFRETILSFLQAIHLEFQKLPARDDRQSVESILYFTVRKRMCQRAFNGDKKSYVTGLLTDVKDGEWEFSETCYANGYAMGVVSILNNQLAALLIDG